MDAEHRRVALAEAAMRIRQLNVERGDSFQDLATGHLNAARDAFRATVGSDIPGPGEDPLLDALMRLQRAVDASPQAVDTACERALALTRVRADAPATS